MATNHPILTDTAASRPDMQLFNSISVAKLRQWVASPSGQYRAISIVRIHNCSMVERGLDYHWYSAPQTAQNRNTMVSPYRRRLVRQGLGKWWGGWRLRNCAVLRKTKYIGAKNNTVSEVRGVRAVGNWPLLSCSWCYWWPDPRFRRSRPVRRWPYQGGLPGWHGPSPHPDRDNFPGTGKGLTPETSRTDSRRQQPLSLMWGYFWGYK